MSDIVTCPDCDTKLKLKTDLQPGKKVRCPKCSTLFAPVSEAPRKPTKSPVEKERRVTSVPKGRRSSVAAEREEEDERPRRRQSSADEEEDGEEDAGNDERPRRARKKQRRKSGNLGLILGLLIGGGVFLVLLVVAGIVAVVMFGRKDSYGQNEAAAKEMIACLEELATTMENIKDRNTAKTGAERINKICDRVEKLTARVEKLPKLTRAEDDRLKKEMQPKLDAVNQRLTRVAFKAGAASQGEPSFLAALQRLQQVGSKLQQLDKR